MTKQSEKIYEIIKKWRDEAIEKSNTEITIQFRYLASSGYLSISTEDARILYGENDCLFNKYANILTSEIEGLKAVHIIHTW